MYSFINGNFGCKAFYMFRFLGEIAHWDKQREVSVFVPRGFKTLVRRTQPKKRRWKKP